METFSATKRPQELYAPFFVI